LAKPVITAPIVGATKLHHLDDAIASVDVKLSAEEVAALEAPYTDLQRFLDTSVGSISAT